MATPEGTLRNKVRDYLKKLKGCWFLKVHGSPFQLMGVPDFIILYQGKFFAAELKVGDNEPTRIQKYVMGKIVAAGGYAQVCTTLDEVKEFISAN